MSQKTDLQAVATSAAIGGGGSGSGSSTKIAIVNNNLSTPSIPNNVSTKMTWNTVESDSNGLYTGSGNFTVPSTTVGTVSGQIGANILFRLGSTNTGQWSIYFQIFKNNTLYKTAVSKPSGTSTGLSEVGTSGVIAWSGVANDVFDIRILQATGLTLTPEPDTAYTNAFFKMEEPGGSSANTSAGKYTPVNNWALGIPSGSAKQISDSIYVRIGNTVHCWGSTYWQNDNTQVFMDITVPITNGNNLTNVSGAMVRTAAVGQSPRPQLDAIASAALPTTGIRFNVASMPLNSNDSFWTYYFTYTLA